MRYIATALVVVFLAVLVILVYGALERRTYHTYDVVRSLEKSQSVSQYAYTDAGVVRYSADGAALIGSKLNQIWNVTYSMSNPQVSVYGKWILIYDRQGTSFYLFNGKKQQGSFSASLPILRACVSGSGTVAALLNNGDKTRMSYYSATGSVIAEGESSMTDPGYPVALSLSENGLGLAVSYLTAADGTVGSTVRFYSFSKNGQKKENNVAAEAAFSGTIIPDLQYIGNECVLFRDNGFTVYKGVDNPKQTKNVDFDEDIVSVFHDSDYVGFVFRSDSREHSYRLRLYSSGGNHRSDQYIDHSYDRVHICGNEVVFSDTVHFSVYSVKGVCRYQGTISEGSITDVIGLGRRKMLLVSDSAAELIRLK